ncbi:MAG: PKD domain-containing protein [Bacteroidota bacterium]
MRCLTTLVLLIVSFSALAAQPANDDCANAEFINLGAQLGCGGTRTTNANGSTTDGAATTPYPVLNCGGLQVTDVSPDVWYTFTAIGNVTTISTSSASIASTYMIIFEGNNCLERTAQACDIGVTTSLTLPTSPGATYYIFLSGSSPTDEGDFAITIDSEQDCDVCYSADNGTLTLNPASNNGTYACGETVNMCFTLSDWTITGTIEWFHSIVPAFGPGWDMSTFTPTVIPPSCDGNGDWDWYPTGWTGCATSTVFPMGFAYDSGGGTAACGGAPNDNDPGNNWGDGANNCASGAGFPGYTFCWTMNVKACPPGSNTFTGEDLTVEVAVYSDGDAGSWGSIGCNSGTTFDVLASVIVCDDQTPLVSFTNATCPGAMDGTITVDANGGNDPGGAYNFYIRLPNNSVVEFCPSCVGQQTFNGFGAGTYIVEVENTTTGCLRSETIVIGEDPAPVASASFPDVCPGGTIPLSGSVVPSSGTISWEWLFGGSTFATTQNTTTTTPGSYTLIATVDGCPSTPEVINVQYFDFMPTLTVSSNNPCGGGGVTFTASGGDAYSWTGPSGPLPVGGPTLSLTNLSQTDAGTYSVLITTTAGCSATLTETITIRTQPTITLDAATPYCLGSAIVITADGAGPGGAYIWQDDFSVDNPRNYVPTSVGPNSLTVQGLAINGCSANATINFNVNPSPTAGIIATDEDICEGESTMLLASGGTVVQWSNSNTTPTINVSPNSTTTYSVTVENSFGCQDDTDIEINVVEELAEPMITCDETQPDQIVFDWTPVPGADFYHIFVDNIDQGTVDGPPFTVINLSPGQTVEIMVVPFTNDDTSCPGLTGTLSCTTLSCDPVTFSFDPIAPICFDGTSQSIPLMVGVPGPGTVTWSGPGVTTTTNPGVFNPLVAGGANTYTITATHTLPNGTCDTSATIDIVVNPSASAALSLSNDDICITEMVTLSLTDGAVAGATYNWDFDGATIESGSDAGPHELSFPNPGDYTISLSTSLSGCTDSDDITITVGDTLAVPEVFCQAVTDSTVTFGWNDVGADSYTVNIISGPAGTLSGTTYTMENLSPGQMVSISVTANITNACPSVTSLAQECQAIACPDVIITVDNAPQTFCDDGANAPIILTATIMGAVNPGPVSWTGPGLTGDSFAADDAGVGMHTLTATVTDEGCPFSATVVMEVLALPTSDFTISPDTVCIDQAVTVTYTGDADPAMASFDWDFAGGTVLSGSGAGPYEVSWPMGGTFDISLAVTENGCTGTATVVPAEVQNPLAAPVINCVNLDIDMVTFEWADVPGATGYEVVLVSGMAGTVNGNTYTVTGMAEGDAVTIEVTALGDGVCGDSAPTEATCQSQTCPEIMVVIDNPPSSFCQDGTGIFEVLSPSSFGGMQNGTYSWSGNGVSNDTFFVEDAPLGPNTITVTYTEGGCSYDTTVVFTLFPVPTADFSISPDSVCTDGLVTVTYQGSASAGATYNWDFGGATIQSGTSAGPYELSSSTGGTIVISLEVTEDGCTSASFVDSFFVETPLETPVVNCIGTDLDNLTFGWAPVVGADSFQVTVLPTNITFFQDSLTYFIDGLSQGETITLEVTALGSGLCGNSAVGSQSCTADVCPILTVTPDLSQNTFCLDDNTPLLLTAMNGGGAGNGSYSWSGMGVSQLGDDFFFNAQVAGLGPHTLSVSYTEGGCSVDNTVDVEVFAAPIVGINDAMGAGPALVCTDQELILNYVGNATAAATFDWDFAGATVVPQPGFETYGLSFASSGLNIVTLSVTENGCTSVEAVFVVNVEAPIGTVNLSCGTGDLNTAVFNWTANAAATEYELIIGGVPFDTTTNLTYTAIGLMPGESVTLTVTPLNAANPCGAGTPASISCSADPCPDFIASLPMVPVPLCLDADPVTLSGVPTGGLGDGTVTWSGPGVVGDVLTPANAGVGTHTIFMDYVEAGPCAFQDSFQIEVLPLPTADFTLDVNEVCVDQTVNVTYMGSAAATATFDWDFGAATVLSGTGGGPYTLSFAAAGPVTISLTVTENGCTGSSVSEMLDVIAPLVDPVIECVNPGLEEVTFSWAAVANATGYDVVVLDGPVGILNGTSYTITGLMPGQEVSISVTALGDPPCGNSNTVEASCSALPCPVITIDIATPAQSFCLDNNASAVQLSASSSGGDMTGTFSWSGPGVVQIGPDFFFDPVLAGLGTWVTIVDYAETAGCSATDSLVMSVVEVPTADFALSSDLICVDEALTLSYTGTAGPNAVYDWDFGGATVTDLGGEMYSLVWTSAGAPLISLTVTEGGCSSNSSQTLTVVAPLELPAPTCGLNDLTEVTIDWPAVPGAMGYQVSSNLTAQETITTTSYTIDNLDPGQEVIFTIVALGSAPCGNTEAVTISCFALPCPDLGISVSAPQTVFCADGLAASQELSTLITGGIGMEVAVWTGPNVSENGGVYSFDPNGLAAGDYTLTASYNEGGVCPFSAELVMTINPEPIAAFVLGDNLLCADATTNLLFNGTATDDATYSWDFDGANVVDNGNNDFSLSWSNAGTYTISLLVSQNGCTDMVEEQVTVEAAPNAGVQAVALERCPDDGSPSSLGDLLIGADAGGIWSALAGTPAGSIDAATGVLNSTGLAAGNYSYLYSISSAVCGALSAQVDITIQPIPLADAGEDQVLTCAMGMVSLNGSNSDSGDGFTYEWTADDPSIVITDPGNRMIEVAQDGVYQIRVTNNIGCSSTDEVVVRAETEVPIPQVELSNISCFSAEDGAIQITEVTGGRPPYTYSLNGQDMDNSGFYPGLTPAEYELRVTDANGCFSVLFLDITQPDQLSVALAVAGESTEVEPGELVTVTARVSGGNAIDTLIWEPDSLGIAGEGNAISFIADETREIRLTVVDELGCRASDNLTIIVRKDRPLFIPTAVSPNGDNNNDVLTIFADNDEVEEIESFLIFNRWGEAVFENFNFRPNDPSEGWDGTHRGQTLNPAVFVYVAVVRFSDGEVITYKGDITLLR